MHRRLLRQPQSWQSCSLASHFTPLQVSEDQILLVSWLQPLPFIQTGVTLVESAHNDSVSRVGTTRPLDVYPKYRGIVTQFTSDGSDAGDGHTIMTIISQFCFFRRRVSSSWTHFEPYFCRLPTGPQTPYLYLPGTIVCLKNVISWLLHL